MNNWLIVACWLWAVMGCSAGEAEIEVRAPAVELSLDGALIALPEELRGAGSSIANYDCRARECPAHEPGSESLLEVACVEGRCDPAAQEVCLDMGRDGNMLRTLDLQRAEPDLDDLLGSIDGAEIERLRYEILANELTVPLANLTLYFGSATARRASEPGVQRLGTLDVVTVGSVTGWQTVRIDSEGERALRDLLRDTSQRAIRLFACTELDLEPGDAFPEGDLRMRIELWMRLRSDSVPRASSRG